MFVHVQAVAPDCFLPSHMAWEQGYVFQGR